MSPAGEIPKALEVTLKKFKPLAPPFHQHIVKSKLKGQIIQAGEEVVVYTIVSTVPEGRVVVDEETILHFT